MSKERLKKALEARSYPNISLLISGLIVSTVEILFFGTGFGTGFVGACFIGIGLTGAALEWKKNK